MNVKRLFQVVVVGGSVLGLTATCGGTLASSGTNGTTNASTVSATRLPDGGTVDGGADTSGTGGGVNFW